MLYASLLTRIHLTRSSLGSAWLFLDLDRGEEHLDAKVLHRPLRVCLCRITFTAISHDFVVIREPPPPLACRIFVNFE